MKHHTLAFLVLTAVLAGGCSKPSQSVAIEPSHSVGPVHSGMTLRQVRAELGPPDRTNYDGGYAIYGGQLQYTRLGLNVGPGKGGVVQSVDIYRPFSGRTKEGIGIGSSRADVIRAYGEPKVDNTPARNFESLLYSNRDLFFIQDGNVLMIVVKLQDAK